MLATNLQSAMPAWGTGQRICPNCAHQTALEDHERLWPKSWRCTACGHGLKDEFGFVQLAAALDGINDGFDLESFDLLSKVEDRHFWFLARNELITWLMQRYCKGARRVLEIGCGTGFVLHALRTALPATSISGSELQSRGLATAAARNGAAVELIQMDARRSYLIEAVDVVGAFDVLEHIPEDEAVLAEIARLLKPGGRLIATVPQHPWMWSAADDVAYHQRRYRCGELAKKANAAGLSTVYQTSFVTLAFPAMAVARLMERMRPGKRSLQEQHDAEFQISPAVNRGFLAVCRFEHWLRRKGLPLPFGGSQVLVAEKPPASTADR